MGGLRVNIPERFDLVITLVHQLQIAQATFVHLFDAFDAPLQELGAFGGLDDRLLAMSVPGFEVLQREGAADVAGREEAVFKVERFEIVAIVLTRSPSENSNIGCGFTWRGETE
jgi:hypothetical protein